MSDFNLVPEIGGVDTSDPSRPYSPEEQKAVLNYVFGDIGPQGSLKLPNEQELYIGQRRISDRYSIRRGSGIHHGLPALFVPRTGARVLAVAQNGGGADGSGLDTFEGFLPTSVGKLLSLGKHTMREVLENKSVKFEPSDSAKHVRSRDYLVQWIVGEALISDPDDDIDEDYAESLEVGVADFLGGELAAQERRDIQQWDGGAFEEYTIELIRRLCLIGAVKDV